MIPLPFLFTIISVIVDLILVFSLLRHFLSTRFFPSFLLFSFYFLFAINDLLYFFTFLLNYTQEIMAVQLLEITVYLGFLTFPFLVLFFESLQKEILSISSVGILLFSTFLIGICTSRPWVIEYVPNFGWNQIFDPVLLISGGIFLILIVFIIIIRFIQVLQVDRETQPRIRPQQFVLLGLILAFLGEMIVQIFNIINLLQVFLSLGFALNAILYLWHPEAFFITPIKIYQIFIIDQKSGLVLFNKGKEVSVLGQGLYASTLIQQEIAGAKRPATELKFGDRTFLIEHKRYKDRHLFAVILLNQKIVGLRFSLRYALNSFIYRFQPILDSKIDNLEQFATFNSSIDTIFRHIPFSSDSANHVKNRE